MSDNLSETPSKSGLILKAAREELSLTLDQVAHELHLRPSVVKAIEDEDYDAFPSDVFLKGYFRSYCRLVDLHDIRMMELLDQQLLSRKKQAEQEELSLKKQEQTKKRKKIFISFLIFLLCVSLVIFTYYIASQDETTSVDSTQNKILPNINADIGNTNTPPTINDDTGISLNNESENVDLISDTKAQEDAVSINSSVNLSHTQPNTETVETQIPENIPVESILTAKFTGDCWFKLTDHTGKVVIAELKKNHDEISYTGVLPVHIVIGDASKVSLNLDATQVDLSDYASANGRAELTLHPSIPDSEG